MKIRNQARIKKIVRALKSYDPERVILFGSAARGDADAYSDIDLVVIKETSEKFLDRIERVIDFVKPDFAFDALVYTPNEFAQMQARENPLIVHVLKEGVTIYERPTGRSRALVRTSRVRPARRAKQRR